MDYKTKVRLDPSKMTMSRGWSILKSRNGSESINKVMRTGRLQGLDHVERKNENDWVKLVNNFEVENRALVDKR